MMDYKVIHANGVKVERYEFDNTTQLEEFFLNHVIGERGIATKVIGNVLLLWNKDA